MDGPSEAVPQRLGDGQIPGTQDTSTVHVFPAAHVQTLSASDAVPFQSDTHHEAHAGQQTKHIDEAGDADELLILDLCHPDDHAADLYEVRAEQIDDVDRRNVVVLHLRENHWCIC